MSHSGGDTGESSCHGHAWSRTPGKPNLSSLTENLPRTSSWTDAGAEEPWPLSTDSSNSRKKETSQWPTPAELTRASTSGQCEYSLNATWNIPSANLTLPNLGGADDHSSSWLPQQTIPSTSTIESTTVPRAITGVRNPAISDNAFNSRQIVPSSSSCNPRGDNFAGWSTQLGCDGKLSCPTLVCTSESEHLGNGSHPVAISATAGGSDSSNHTGGQSDSDTVIRALLNSKECWGRVPVDQCTRWEVPVSVEEDSGIESTTAFNASGNITPLGDAVSLVLKQRRGIKCSGSNLILKSCSSLESNVWSSEPPTGTAVWEMHYQSLNDRTSLWKQNNTASTSASRILSNANSPPANHRSVSAFMNQPPPLQPNAIQQQRPFPTNFFPQQPQRFSHPSGSHRGTHGLNGVPSNPSSFKPLQPTTLGSTAWSFSLTPDSQSPIDESKRSVPAPPQWSSDGPASRAISKQQVLSGDGRWTSPNDSPWHAAPTVVFPRTVMPWTQQAATAPQRFHRQNAPVPVRHLTPVSLPNSSFFRNDMARQLANLGFNDEANALFTDHTIIDVERFLLEMWVRTGGLHHGLNQLINSVSPVLMATPGSGFGSLADLQQHHASVDAFDNRIPVSYASKQTFPPVRHHQSLPQGPNSELINQLLLREHQLQSTIISLDKKRRELGMRHAQLQKMNVGGPTAHHSNSMQQEILIQQAQISQQIDAQEAQLSQVHYQIDFFNRIAPASINSGGNSNDETAMLMRLRATGTTHPQNAHNPGIANRITQHHANGPSGGTRKNGGMILTPSTSAELASKIADLKLSMDTGRRIPWDGASTANMWDMPPSHQFPIPSSEFPHVDGTPNVFLPSSSGSLGGDRRWADGPPQSQNATGGGPAEFYQSPQTSFDKDIWSTSWLLLSDLAPQFSLEVLRVTIVTALEQQPNGSAMECSGSNYEIHTNLPSRYVLVGFGNAFDASAISIFISNSGLKLAGNVSIISPSEALAKLHEIKITNQVDDNQQQQQGNPSHWPEPLLGHGNRNLQKTNPNAAAPLNE